MSTHWIEQARLLTPLGGAYAGGEKGYLDLSDDGAVFWAYFSGPRISIPWPTVTSAEAMEPGTARQHVAGTAISLEGVEANFWTACHQDCAFLFLERSDSPTVGFQFLGTSLAEVRTKLAPFVSNLPAPGVRTSETVTPESNSTGDPDPPTPVAYDLSEWSDDQRQALVTELVENGIAHGWTGPTLNVSPDARATVDAITSELDRPPSPPETPAPVTATVGIEPSGGQDQMSERLGLLERLIAVRDAGGLTPEEFEAARDKAARKLVQDDE